MQIIEVNKENVNQLLNDMLSRGTTSFPAEEAQVQEILSRVQTEGDAALLAYTAQFDGASLTPATLRVSEEEIKQAYESIDPALLAVIRKAKTRIEAFHAQEKQKSWFMTEDDLVLGQRVTPLSRAGLYVPGGKASYPSSVLMNVVPAKVAGVKEIIMCTPPDKNACIDAARIVAACEGGVDVIYKVGGAQAIAAMAFGTATIPRVDKITGPGNIYVALTKRAVYGHVSIDSVAGPSEIVVLADESADPRYVAADLLSQAEHDELASAILVTTSETLAEAVNREVEALTAQMPRREIIQKSLDAYGRILLAEHLDDAVAAVNALAPEHLELLCADAFLLMTRIQNAGAIFVGPYSSEPFGDYFAGPNHVLPTNGTARFFSALSVDDFIKKSSIIYSGRSALASMHEDIEQFAQAEGLDAHANSIATRFKEEEK